ncbi:MAG: RagB/SusD family nutrient uptake outer membrane protein, partial [Duncaniella sp.]|nr:RagB/SusD family nutrient uptake outer membrane protein [Duncaniella sp.]
AIYDPNIGDMQACVDDLPWFSESDYGSAPERLTRQAAKGILARICLYAGGYSLRWNTETNDASTLHMGRRDDEARVRELYTIADNALKEVIEHGENSLIQNTSSMSGYQTLFYNYCQRNFGVTSQEMMWHIASLGESTNFDFSIYNGQPGCMGGTYGSRKTLQVKLPTYYLSFAANDTRRDVTCANYSITFLSDATNLDGSNCATTFSSIMPGKFRIQWCQAPYAAAKRNVDVPLLRYADVLLMYAETQNYLNNGPTGAAISALQEVRDRAGIGSMPIASGSHDEFLETIMQERKWELGDELVVRGDLIRTNLIEKEIRQDQQDIKDLSDRTGKYADVAPIRLVKLEMSSCTYGEKFLTVPFIEITDADEIALLSPTPQVNTA